MKLPEPKHMNMVDGDVAIGALLAPFDGPLRVPTNDEVEWCGCGYGERHHVAAHYAELERITR